MGVHGPPARVCVCTRACSCHVPGCLCAPVVQVADEAHGVKCLEGSRYQRLMQVDAQRKLLLTGTPVQNNLRELFTMLRFATPSVFQAGDRVYVAASVCVCVCVCLCLFSLDNHRITVCAPSPCGPVCLKGAADRRRRCWVRFGPCWSRSSSGE